MPYGNAKKARRGKSVHEEKYKLTGVAILILTLSAPLSGCGETTASAEQALDLSNAAPRGVAALGRLEPMNGVIRISASSLPEAPAGGVLARLDVEVGDDVTAGQLLAVTDTAEVLRAKVDEARAQLTLAEQQAAASQSAAAAACVRAGVLQREADRLTTLESRDLAAEDETDRARGAAEAANADCAAAESAARVAEADIDVAKARLGRHRKELDLAEIHAPVSGKVLVIHARPGEHIDTDGVLELGRVDRMYAIAEVYEADVGRLRVGQQATVSSVALDEQLTGRVERIRPIVRKMDQIGTDPAARKDARIVEVEVILDEPERAAAYTHLQVDVNFAP